MSADRETLIYPNVLAATKVGDRQRDGEAPIFVEFVTNNQDTVVRGYIYWYIPERGFCERHGGPWGEDETCPNCTELDGSPKREVTQPVLMIEIDDEDTGGPDPMDITIRVRRNDGLVYEGDRASQEEIPELVPHREDDGTRRARRMSLIEANALDIPTLEEWLKDDLPHATYAAGDDEDMGRRLSEESYHAHVSEIREARKALSNLTRTQLDRLATMILKEEG